MVDKKLKKQAEGLAKHGRFGDDRMLHVSQAEIDGLASLVPGGRLPTNPKTGQPEAFFFLPFLAGLGAMAAPAAAATTAGLAATAGGLAAAAAPAAAGLAAAAPAAAGLTAAAAPAAAGLTAAAAPAAAGLTAAAAPAAAGLTAATAPAAAGLTAAATPAASGLASLAAPTAAGAGGTAAAAGLPTVAPTLGSGTLFGPTLAATTVPANAAPAAASGGLGSLAAATPGAPGSLFGSTMATGKGVASALPAMSSPASTAAAAAPAASGQTAASAAGTSAAGGFPAAPPPIAGSGITGGLGFPAAPAAPTQSGGLGGLMGGMDMNKMLQYGAMASMMMPKGGGGSSKKKGSGGKVGKDYDRGEMVAPEDGGINGGITEEWDYFPNSRYYAEGGIASLNDGGGAEMSDDALVDAAIAAIQGQSPNADAILKMFVQQFGPEALQDLAARVQGQQAASDGLSDSVPAVINSNGMSAPAQLSEGEYVVPADVVSGLGNGSTSAGARQLEEMVSRTREMRGTPAKPKAIDPAKALPH